MSIDKKTIRSIILGVAACIILSWLLHETERVSTVLTFFKGMFSPFVAGAIVAFILNVPMRGIEKHMSFIKNEGLRRAASLTLTLLFILLILALILFLLIPQVVETGVTLFYQLKDLVQKYPVLQSWINNGKGGEDIDWTALMNQAVNLVGAGVPSIVSGTLSAIGSVYTGVFNAVISLVFAIYCLARKEILARQFKRLAYAFLPEKFCDGLIHILQLTNQTFSSFISGQCIEACILGCLFAIAMTIFGMPYVPLISVLIAVTALVPIVGAFIGCIFGAFFILVGNPMQAVWFVVMFLIIQQIENNVIYPKVVGKSVGLPGMWVLLSVTVGGTLFGVIGMVLMIPLVSVFYTLLGEITDNRLKERNVTAEKTSNKSFDAEKDSSEEITDENETR